MLFRSGREIYSEVNLRVTDTWVLGISLTVPTVGTTLHCCTASRFPVPASDGCGWSGALATVAAQSSILRG